MRSFHAKEGSGEDSYCDTLGYTEAEVEVCVVLLSNDEHQLEFLVMIFYFEIVFYFQAMKLFLCKNCEYKQHQCFICGVLEPSNGAAAKVYWYSKEQMDL